MNEMARQLSFGWILGSMVSLSLSQLLCQ